MPALDGVGAAEAHSVFGPFSGWNVPAPVGSSTVVDLTEFAGTYVRITCTVEDIYYVFTDDAANTMTGLQGDFKFDNTLLVPDVIGEGFSVREIVPEFAPLLLVRSQTATPGEVRIRRA